MKHGIAWVVICSLGVVCACSGSPGVDGGSTGGGTAGGQTGSGGGTAGGVAGGSAGGVAGGDAGGMAGGGNAGGAAGGSAGGAAGGSAGGTAGGAGGGTAGGTAGGGAGGSAGGTAGGSGGGASTCASLDSKCDAGSDCCSGVCLPTADTSNAFGLLYRCTPSPVASCADAGSCVHDTDCCSGQCMNGVCVAQTTSCVANLGYCLDDTDCCGDSSCNISNSAGLGYFRCLLRSQQGGRIYPGFACTYHVQCYQSVLGFGACITPADGGTRVCSNNPGCKGFNDYCGGGCCSGLQCSPAFGRCLVPIGGPCDSSSDCFAGSCGGDRLCH